MAASHADILRLRDKLPSPAVDRARRRLWLTLALIYVGGALGIAWDGAWHATRGFDSFFSPPHLFVYAVAFVCFMLVVSLIASPSLRVWFGPDARVGPLAAPGSLALLAGGFVVLGLAGSLDSVWHTAFGLDETPWSAPHAMIGWGLLTIGLGFTASRLALGDRRPVARAASLGLGLLVLQLSAAPFLGPLNANRSLAEVEAKAAIPALAAEPSFQATIRIYQEWNLTRANPLLILLGALWAGAVLAFLRGFLKRDRRLLAVVGLWSLLALLSARGSARRLDQWGDVSSDPGSWLVLPLLPAALALLALLRLNAPRGMTHGAVGFVFGLATFAIWADSPWTIGLALPAAGLAIIGARLGAFAHAVIDRPTRNGVALLLGVAVLVPLLTGSVDLILRATTS